MITKQDLIKIIKSNCGLYTERNSLENIDFYIEFKYFGIALFSKNTVAIDEFPFVCIRDILETNLPGNTLIDERPEEFIVYYRIDKDNILEYTMNYLS